MTTSRGIGRTCRAYLPDVSSGQELRFMLVVVRRCGGKGASEDGRKEVALKRDEGEETKKDNIV